MRGTVAHLIAAAVLLAIGAFWYVQKEEAAALHTAEVLPRLETAPNAKIEAALRKAEPSKIEAGQAFVTPLRVEGREYIVAFRPGLPAGYLRDDTLARLNRDFSEKLFLLALAALLIKAALVIVPPLLKARDKRR